MIASTLPLLDRSTRPQNVEHEDGSVDGTGLRIHAYFEEIKKQRLSGKKKNEVGL